jgi:sporulation protein YlmC with PRC-barrel domain
VKKEKVMVQSIKQLYGNKLGASDGEIGHVKDFYFDDQSWAVRYLVVDTGNWLPRRQVLLAPHSLNGLDQAAKVLRVNLTREQIERSPAIEQHKPVSRRYEEEYYKHYGWPYYWQGDALWGMSGFPILEQATTPLPVEQALLTANYGEGDNGHLRSMKAVKGYHLQASDGIIGHVCDFMMDPQSWAIRQLVIKIGHRFTGKEVEMPVSKVDRISYEESAVCVNLTMEAVEQSFAHDLALIGAGD